MLANFINGYIGGHGALIVLKSVLFSPNYIIKFTALQMHPDTLSVSNEFGWDDIESDSSKIGYAITSKQNTNNFRKQKFNPLNSRTNITINGVIAPFMYFAFDKLLMKKAQPFETIQLLRELGLRGVKFNAYTTDGVSVGVWVLKSVDWDNSNFQYASNAAKIEFSAHFAVDLQHNGQQQYENTIQEYESGYTDLLEKYPYTKWQ